MMIDLCSCFRIRRWWLSPDTNTFHVFPYLFIINYYTVLRHSKFNITHFVLTQKINWYISINFLLTDNTTCFYYRLKHTFSSLNNSRKLPLPLSDNLYQYDGDSKRSIHMINEAKALRALVNEYLSSTAGSKLLLSNKLAWMTGGHFVTVISLDDN